MDSSDVLALVLIAALLIPPALVVILIYFLVKQRRRALRSEGRLQILETRFAPVVSLEDEVRRLQDLSNGERERLESLKGEYRAKKRIYDDLVREAAIYDEKIAFAEMGVYEPHFDFTDSETYKLAVTNVRDRQKGEVARGTAVICRTEWQVDGSVSKGRTMTTRNIRLTLRAFNNECDAAISNTRWNNVNAMEKRIVKAREQIDKLNASNATVIADEYLGLKLQELYLTHEYREKLRQEKEERAEAARLAKEEQRLLRDLDEAQEEELHYARMLEKAKAEAETLAGQKLEVFAEQVRLLEHDLEVAHAKAERARALAEKTRSGYVYIISNIGSFGPDVVKIGLTRRLNPTDRVQELGDASVPFPFDTHAIIYSDDAPALERALHAEFEQTRVNTNNMRKEFFRTNLDAIERSVAFLAPEAAFFKDIEAQDYRETLARREAMLQHECAGEETAFPAEI